jgi:hypothetical protein
MNFAFSTNHPPIRAPFCGHTDTHMQLTKDRPDVVKYMPSELQSHIRSLPGEIALEVLGALHDTPKGWDKGIKQPAKQLGDIARRAEAHARAFLSGTAASGAGVGAAAAGGSRSFGDAAEEDDGWVTAGKGTSGQGSSSNVSGTNGHAGPSSTSSSSSAVTAAGMIKQLERQRPDVWQHLEERHLAVIKPLTQDKQKQVRGRFY